MMDTVKFILPPAIGSLGVAKLIACQPSALGSLQIGIGCLATIATASYYICKKYAPKQHTKSNETESDKQEGAEQGGTNVPDHPTTAIHESGHI